MTECPCCHQPSETVERRHQNTAYVDEESNWLVSCLPCFEEGEVYWAELWADYYASRGC